ncbi:MAG TPA: exodeoxyribonuclease VII small subunit [Smithellaceae bacterium]|nr:exodeoxyribonuclease VII small subunit [Smithellaceae bacterium]
MAKEKFEDAMDKLETIVREMEAGQMPLDSALKSFEEGIRLIRLCQAKLDDTQRRVDQLLEKNDQTDTRPFAHEEGHES